MWPSFCQIFAFVSFDVFLKINTPGETTAPVIDLNGSIQ